VLRTDSCLASIIGYLLRSDSLGLFGQIKNSGFRVTQAVPGCKHKCRRGIAAVNAVRVKRGGLLDSVAALGFPDPPLQSCPECSKNEAFTCQFSGPRWRPLQSFAIRWNAPASRREFPRIRLKVLAFLANLLPGTNLTAYPSDV